jgi:ubiquinone/menaquinone biosynthesis C-methylase UbiE
MTDVEQLKTRLAEIERISNEQWMASLEDRKKRELEFHDLHRDKSRMEAIDEDTYEKFYGNKKYYGATGLSKVYVDNWIEQNAKDKIFLDYACGNGGNAIKAAKAGARLAIGIDISSASIENARQDASVEGVTQNTCFLQADAENTLLPDESIDTLICSGVLHHMDLSRALTELRRILSPGGRILAVEALDYNPAIKLYRNLTPAMRTEWEKSHILSLADVEFAKQYFQIGEVRYWHITSILYPYVKPLLPLFNLLDSVLTRIPLVRLMAWIFTFELVKPGK